jgi:hypothetical protein
VNVHAEQLIAHEDQLLFRDIQLRLSTLIIDNCISCHVIAEAVSRRWPQLKVKHGRFMSAYEHSWLETKQRNIIDVYPIAIIGGPLLIDGRNGWTSGVYEETEERWEIEPTTLASIVKRLS